MDDRDRRRDLVDALTDEALAEALEYLRFVIEERHRPAGPHDIDRAGRDRPRDD